MHAPIPPNEAERVSALHALKVLDTAPESDFDDIVGLASEICGAPISLVTLVDTDRQWFKAKIGIAVDETPREVAFCAHAIMGRDLLVVPDAMADTRFADNPYVTADHGIRFYAGAPLITSDGSALGTLCVVDHDPHRLNLDQMRALRALARQVAEYLELRRLSVVPESAESMQLRPVDLAYLVEGRIQQLRPIADARNTAITLALTEAPIVNADPQRLGQALDYIVFNALKTAPLGGRVAVRVIGEPCPTVEIGHAGGSIRPAWQWDLDGVRAADEPVPHAAAEVLRAHEAKVVTTSQPLGSPDVRFQVRFPVV